VTGTRSATVDAYSWLPDPASRASSPSAKTCASLCVASPLGEEWPDLPEQLGGAPAVVRGHGLCAVDEQGAQVHRLVSAPASLPFALHALLLLLLLLLGVLAAAHGDTQGLHFFEAQVICVDDHFIDSLAGFLGLGHHQLALPARLGLQVIIVIPVMRLLAAAAKGAVGGQELVGLLLALEERLVQNVPVVAAEESRGQHGLVLVTVAALLPPPLLIGIIQQGPTLHAVVLLQPRGGMRRGLEEMRKLDRVVRGRWREGRGGARGGAVGGGVGEDVSEGLLSLE